MKHRFWQHHWSIVDVKHDPNGMPWYTRRCNCGKERVGSLPPAPSWIAKRWPWLA